MTRVAVIGAGFMGQVHAASYGKGNLDAEVACIVDRNPAGAAALADKLSGQPAVTDSVEKILRDPTVDAVDICVPTPFHCDLVVKAAEAGKHVLCEKPLAMSGIEADKMIRACDKAGVCFQVAHVLRFWPEYMETARLIESGAIGAVRHVSCLRLSAPPSWSAGGWIADPARGGGAIRDLAIHDYDFVNWIAGPVRNVSGYGNPHHFAAVLQTVGGPSASIEASYAMPAAFPFRMAFRVTGETGVIEFDGAAGGLQRTDGAGVRKVEVAESSAFIQNSVSEEVDGYVAEIRYFLDCIRTKATPERGVPAQARHAVMIALAVEKSVAHGATVAVGE